jgi:hypothetical protein
VFSALSATEPVSLRLTSAAASHGATYHGYKRWKRYMYDRSASFSSSVGLSGKRANVVCRTFHAARPSSALSRHVSRALWPPPHPKGVLARYSFRRRTSPWRLLTLVRSHAPSVERHWCDSAHIVVEVTGGSKVLGIARIRRWQMRAARGPRSGL